jgi:hypothetical protein
MDSPELLQLDYSNRKLTGRRFRAMRVVLPFSGGLISGALLAFGSRACDPSVIFPSELFIFSLVVLLRGLIALPVYASAFMFFRCSVARVELSPISGKAAWCFGLAIPMFGMTVLGVVGATCSARMPFFRFELPVVGSVYGSDSQPEVWGITLGLLSVVLLAAVAPMFLLDRAVTRAAGSRQGAAKWPRLLLEATSVATVVLMAACGGFWLAHAIGGSNDTAERLAIVVVLGMLGIATVIAVFSMDWPPARRLATGLRAVKRGWVVIPALLLALVASEAPEHIQAYLFERDCSKLAQWLGAHQTPGSYTALPLPGEFARLSSDGSADAIIRRDGGVVLVLNTQWWELTYSTSSDVPPEIKTDPFGRQYLPISWNRAYLIDRQLNGDFYVGEAWDFPPGPRF